MKTQMTKRQIEARLEEVSALLKETDDQLESLLKRRDSLRKERDSPSSQAFILANGIRRSDVEMSDGDERPYFGTICEFSKWLRINSQKNWAEWNTVIYRQSDLKAGRMPSDMPARIGDLQN